METMGCLLHGHHYVILIDIFVFVAFGNFWKFLFVHTYQTWCSYFINFNNKYIFCCRIFPTAGTSSLMNKIHHIKVTQMGVY